MEFLTLAQIFEAERELLHSHKLRIPFPEPRPAEDAKYTLAYSKPANINVVGSYARKTVIQVGDKLEVDLAVTMPSVRPRACHYLLFPGSNSYKSTFSKRKTISIIDTSTKGHTTWPALSVVSGKPRETNTTSIIPTRMTITCSP